MKGMKSMEISVSRPRQYVDRVRAYELFVDGRSVAKIRAGTELRIVVPDDAKTLVARVDWCSSNEFSLADLGANATLEVKNPMGRKMWFPFYPIYAVTFNRKSYLLISEAR
jgi:hypothetical protein